MPETRSINKAHTSSDGPWYPAPVQRLNVQDLFFDLYGTLPEYEDMKAAWAAWLAVVDQHLADHGLSQTQEQLDSFVR